jgi:hypothetical protein
MPGAQCARSLACEMKKHTSVVTTVTPVSPGIPRAMVLTVSFALSPVTGYSIHTFWSFRLVPYLMRRKASRPSRITFGPGFP